MARQSRRSRPPRREREPRRRRTRELPPPLPPETRTVGQLVAESIRLYGSRFWRSLALGIPPAVVGVALAEVSVWIRVALLLTIGSAAASLSYACAASFAAGIPLERRRILTAAAVGFVIVEPAALMLAFLSVFGLLPAVAWLGFVGLVVPVAVIEDRVSVRRAAELGRADLAHSIGSLATLTLVGLLTAYVLFFTLRSAGTAALRVAAFLSVLVISPLLFLGAALLYFDQAARVGSAPRPRRPDADLHPAVQPDRAGRADAEGEPGAAARSQP
jgi:hypothetical protein